MPASANSSQLEHLFEGLVPKYAATIVRALLQLEDARTRQLNRLEARVEDLLDGPYFTGREYLEESLAGPTDAARRASARQARHAFVEAHSHYRKHPLKASYSSAHVAVIDYMLGNAEATRWARRAASEASAALNAERAKVGYIEVGGIRTTSESVSNSLGTLYLIGTGLVAMMAVTASLKGIGLPIYLDAIVGIVAFWVVPFVILDRFKGIDKGIDRLAGSATATQQRQAANELEEWVASLDTLAAHTGRPAPRLQAL